MSCRCKHQFCYACGGDYPTCECNKANAVNPFLHPLFGGGGFNLFNPIPPIVQINYLNII